MEAVFIPIMAEKENRPWIRRIFSPLFNLETGDSQSAREVRGQGSYSMYRFKVTTWKQSSEHSIEIPMEYDLLAKKFTGNTW